MKLLFDAHSVTINKTGIGVYCERLVEGYSQKNIDLYLYSGSLSHTKSKKYVPLMENGLYRVLFGLTHACTVFKPDILHVQHFAPIVKTCKIVNTVHDVCFKTHKAGYGLLRLLTFKLFFQFSLYQSDKIICVSESTKQQLLKYYSVDPSKISVVHSGPGRIITKTKNTETSKYPYLLCVGNIESRKNPLKIVEYFKTAEKQFPNLKLIFVGNNYYYKYKDIIKTNKIEFAGYLSNLKLDKLYKNSLGVIYLSKCEGFGFPILEAFQHKVPVIMSDIKVFREIAGNAGLYVKNKKQFTKAIKTLFDKNKRPVIIRKETKRLKLFDWKKTISLNHRVYSSLSGK